MHFDLWTFALQTVNFAVLVWLLRRFLYRPVLAMVDAREAALAKRAEDAAAATALARARLAEIETTRAGLAHERDEILRAAAEAAEALAREAKDKADRAADAWMTEARNTLATERAQVMAEARRAALDLGGAFATRLLAELPPPLLTEAWIEPVERHLRGLSEEARAALAAGGSVQVNTAAPLSPAAEDAWRRRLRAVLGEALAVRFAADPALAAGADLDFGASVLRFSWRGLMETMRAGIETDEQPV